MFPKVNRYLIKATLYKLVSEIDFENVVSKDLCRTKKSKTAF